METDTRTSRLEAAAQLVRLSRLDWGYADLYLRAAEETLRPAFSPEQYEVRVRERESLARLAAEARRAVQRGDWREAERLAESGVRTRRSLEDEARLLATAEAVYGRRSFSPDATALALTGALAHPAESLRARIRELAGTLRSLERSDARRKAFYAARAEHFEHLDLRGEEAATSAVDPSELRQAALEAADAGNFAEIARVARGAALARRDRLGRTLAPRPTSGWIERLADPLPTSAVERAAKLGLEPISVPVRADLNAYLSCGCAERPGLPDAPLSEERRQPGGCTCGHPCPPGVSPGLKSSLDALMVHPFVTSEGTRYLPWFGAETLLLETFPEDRTDDAGGVLEALSLPRRRGLPRVAIEEALLRRGPELCERAGLDPQEHRLVCVPFDVYLRAAPERGWGQRELWTHFDGYQVTRELQLHALVGGDVRFGGPSDLCGVARAYDSERILTRFALVRRARFLAREPSA